ncbi:MAG: toll/interleukin-1 receptor domain-containing protein [Nitrosarchaeum sp.]|nr:MAG: toll/interleukin-1 receptor domain-containing protein [Nitrosarchaeum sp.]
MSDYNTELFRLRRWYRLLIELLDVHFGSGYVIRAGFDTNLFYLKICVIIEKILEQPDFKNFPKEWKPFDHLLDLDEEYPEGDWELGQRKICTSFFSYVEKEFLRNGEQFGTITDDETNMFNNMFKFIIDYKQEKDQDDKNFLKNIENMKSKSNLTEYSIDIPIDKFDGRMNVFISHKFIEQDQLLALKLRTALRKNNIEGYLAESKKEYELLIGDKIREAIDKSDYVVGIITESSQTSSSVNQELGYALGTKKPIVIMIEKDVQHGVLTHGRETEEFSRENFDNHCRNVINYILEKGERVKPNSLSQILREKIYPQLYDKMMAIHTNPDKFNIIISNPWKELPPSYRLNVEDDVKNIFKHFSIQLEHWNEVLSSVNHSITLNQSALGEIIREPFAKVSLVKPDGHIILDERSSQEPRYWIEYFKFIIFDESIISGTSLYEKMLNYAKEKGSTEPSWLIRWNAERPQLFDEIYKILPDLRKQLRVNFTDDIFGNEKQAIGTLIEQITKLLEEKLK